MSGSHSKTNVLARWFVVEKSENHRYARDSIPFSEEVWKGRKLWTCAKALIATPCPTGTRWRNPTKSEARRLELDDAVTPEERAKGTLDRRWLIVVAQDEGIPRHRMAVELLETLPSSTPESIGSQMSQP